MHAFLQQRPQRRGHLRCNARDIVGPCGVQAAAVCQVVEARRVDEVAQRRVAAACARSLHGGGWGATNAWFKCMLEWEPRKSRMCRLCVGMGAPGATNAYCTCRHSFWLPSKGSSRAIGVPGQASSRPFRTTIIDTVMLLLPSLVP